MRRTLTVRLAPTARTDLPCIVCGRFRTHAAIITPDVAEPDASAGIHRECLPGRRARSTATKEASP